MSKENEETAREIIYKTDNTDLENAIEKVADALNRKDEETEKSRVMGGMAYEQIKSLEANKLQMQERIKDLLEEIYQEGEAYELSTGEDYKTSNQRCKNIYWDMVRWISRHGATERFLKSFIVWKDDCVKQALAPKKEEG